LKSGALPKIIVTGSLLLMGALLSGCGITVSQYAEGPWPIETLLIDKSSLPANIFYVPGSKSEKAASSRVGMERIGTIFESNNGGGVVQDVYRFSNVRDAQNEHNDVSKYYFSNQENRTIWEQPEDLKYLKINADAFKIACSTIIDINPNVEVCQYVAQYDSYMTYLSADMVALNHNDFSRLISAIDQKMSLCFDGK
jgi:hypothetical protein